MILRTLESCKFLAPSSPGLHFPVCWQGIPSRNGGGGCGRGSGGGERLQTRTAPPSGPHPALGGHFWGQSLHQRSRYFPLRFPPVTHTPDNLWRKSALGLNGEFEARENSDSPLWPQAAAPPLNKAYSLSHATKPKRDVSVSYSNSLWTSE